MDKETRYSLAGAAAELSWFICLTILILFVFRQAPQHWLVSTSRVTLLLTFWFECEALINNRKGFLVNEGKK